MQDHAANGIAKLNGGPASHRNNFDLIRLAAAAQVMVGHAVAHLQLPIPTWLEQLLNAFPGVPIFFVVSGFLICSSFRRQASLRNYAASRALRIYPALWVNLVGITVLLAWAGSLAMEPTQPGFWAWHLVAFLFGSDFLASGLIGGLFSTGGPFIFYPSGVLWTLPVELSFYLLVPIIFAKQLTGSAALAISVMGWIGASLICYFFIGRAGSWVIFIGLYLWIFMLGAAAQTYWERIKTIFVGRAPYWLAGHLLLTFTVIAFEGSSPVYVKPDWISIVHTCSLAATTLSCAYTLPGLSQKLLKGRDISYGLYLWHMPVFCVFMVYGLTGAWWYFLIAAAIAVAIADLSRRFVEQPALSWRHKRVATRIA